MANIDNELLEICAASEGAKVRDSIATALKKINEDRRYSQNKTLIVGREDNHRTIEGGPWDKVVVAVPQEGEPDSTNIAMTLDDFVIDANGYYDLWTTGWPAGHGWKSFTVNVPGAEYKGGDITIEKNGEFDPIASGYDGYSKVTVSVPDGGMSGDTFTVVFHDKDETVIEEQTVAYGEDATFSGELPRSDTAFMGWDPDPVHVTYNMHCYPIFLDKGYRGSIEDDWITIQKKLRGGIADYEIGMTRKIPCQGLNGEVEMVLLDISDSIKAHDQFKEYKGKYFGRQVSLWISKYALFGSHIKPEEVLDDSIKDISVDIRKIQYEETFVPANIYQGLYYEFRGGPCSWAAFTYYWYMFGYSWGYRRPNFDGIADDYIAYEAFSNGGAYEMHQYFDRLTQLGINRNKYLGLDGRSESNVNIVLDTDKWSSNLAPYSREYDPETGTYSAYTTGPTPELKQLYSGASDASMATYNRILAEDRYYDGNRYNPGPYYFPVMQLPEFGSTESTTTGYSREFLIL